MKQRSPWSWIPTLYFGQGIPYVVVMSVAVIMYKRLGISNTDIALYTSWLYLPWVIKPFWSPFVDILKSKRWWIVTMQLLIGAGLAGVAFLIPAPFFFQATLAVLWLLAFSSATHDIAADGFYMLALDSGQQSFFVGIRSTFYRLAMITGQGALIIFAGALESATGMEPLNFEVQAIEDAPTVVIGFDEPMWATTRSGVDAFEVTPAMLQMSLEPITADSMHFMLAWVAQENGKNGFIPTETDSPIYNKVSVADFKGQDSTLVGNVGVAVVRLLQAPKAGDEVVLNLSRFSGDKSISLISADRLLFTSENWEDPAYVLVKLDNKLQQPTTATFRGNSGNIPLAWSITFMLLAGLFIALSIYHRFILPRPESDSIKSNQSSGEVLRAFGETFKSFFLKPGIGVAIAFMLLYRLGEAMLVKMVTPFMLDGRELGGLGLTTGQVGVAYGTVGVVALTLGGILGGVVTSRRGLRFWIWPMALSITLPNLCFLYLSMVQPESMLWINIAVAIEQFGYGFGFTAYMLYLIYISDGAHKTAHYALCTGFMALGMMLPGMAAGWIQEQLGYEYFFVLVVGCALITLSVIPFMKIDATFGRKKME